MPSIEQVKGSNGSSNANVATIQNSRSSGASTIIVDTVLGINTGGFAGSMGTPHIFTDPITSEIITVISEATAVDFTGHVDGSNLEIDDIAPGYVDAGSAVGDIVIIRPTTQYANNIAEVLEESLNDDGTLKSDIIVEDKIADNSITGSKLATDAIKLGRTSVTSDSASLSDTTVVEVAGYSTTITNPAGGRDLEIEVVMPKITSGTTMNVWVSIWKTAVGGGGTQLQEFELTLGASAHTTGLIVKAIDVAPAAGSITYKVGFRVSTNAATINSAADAPSYIVIKAT